MADNRHNITGRFVQAAKPSDKVQFFWDVDLRGFGLRVTPAGSKSYVAQSRINGRTERVTIGDAGMITVKEARTKAARIRSDAKEGKRSREEAAANINVDDLFALWMSQKIEVDRKPRTIEHYRMRYDTHIRKRLGKMVARTVKAKDITAMRTEMLDRRPSFNTAADVIRALINWGVDEGHLPDDMANPVRKSHYHKIDPRETALTPDQVASVISAIAELEGEPGGISVHAAAAIRLLILTGARRREITEAQWSWLEIETVTRNDETFERAILHLPDSKTGKKDIILTGPAFEIATGVPKMLGNPFIFVGQKPGRPLSDIAEPWRRICGHAGLVPGRSGVTLHDLRHSFATLGAGAGIALSSLGKVLGHTNETMTSRYVNPDREDAAAAAEIVAKEHERIIAKAGNVVPLKRSA